MKKILFVVALFWASANASAEQTFAEIDREMIAQLGLDQSQALVYVRIMQAQRKVYHVLEAPSWQTELAFYQQTFALLKPVLTERQLAMFVGIIDSFFEDNANLEDGVLLTMED